jgi:hypothetical protein
MVMTRKAEKLKKSISFLFTPTSLDVITFAFSLKESLTPKNYYFCFILLYISFGGKTDTTGIVSRTRYTIASRISSQEESEEGVRHTKGVERLQHRRLSHNPRDVIIRISKRKGSNKS